MEQKKLYRTLETVASKNFKSETELLTEVIQQIVENEEIKVTGGRIWKLDPAGYSYNILLQTGNLSKIPEGFSIPIDEYPLFERVVNERTVLGPETNDLLRSKGILIYSASGVGPKIKVNGKRFYKYLLAVNSDMIDDELRYTINIIATVLTSKLNERFLSQSQKNLMADIDKARELQRSILPEHEYRFHFYDIFGVTYPAEIVGGDFYDYLKIGDNEDRLGIAVGDAASKGLGAAAEAMYISGALRMASTFEIKISPMMFRMNQLINKIFSDDKFTTMFYGELSTDKKGLFLYANAGHNPPIFYSSKSKQLHKLMPTGPLLGPAPHSKYETDSINFRDGDVLVIFSDGVVESANNNYEFYGDDRLMNFISANAEKTPKEIATGILEEVFKFTTNDSSYQDDKTIVVIKRRD